MNSMLMQLALAALGQFAGQGPMPVGVCRWEVSSQAAGFP